MPLITITGYPSSGKSTRAQQIHAYFANRISTFPPNSRESRLKLHIVSSHDTLHLSRSLYRDSKDEKQARAAEYSAVKRLLGKEDVVILDGLNYIKGFRYQLYCEAKTALTRSCVVHVAAPAGVCREWNSGRGAGTEAGGGWEEGLLEELVSRFEEPNGMSRWDSPLFTVPYVDESPDCEGIWRAVVDGGDTVVRANQATVLRPAEEGEYLHELGRVTQEVVGLVLERQRGGGGGGVMPVPGCAVALKLPEGDLTPSQLQGVRRDFTKLNRNHVVGKERIRELFMEYFNKRFE